MRFCARSLIMVCLSACGASWAADATPAQQTYAQNIIKQEEKVLDAYWKTAKWLYIGVYNDGTRRDGYAAYICASAKAQGAEMVKIIDIVQLKRTGKWVELGRAMCK